MKEKAPKQNHTSGQPLNPAQVHPQLCRERHPQEENWPLYRPVHEHDRPVRGRIITQTLTEAQAERTFSLHARKAGDARLGGAGTTRPALYGYEALSNPTQASGRDGPDAHWESMNGGKDKECLYLFPVKKQRTAGCGCIQQLDIPSRSKVMNLDNGGKQVT